MHSQDWDRIRAQFPAASTTVFLNSGSRGLLSLPAYRVAVDLLEQDLFLSGAHNGQAVLAMAREYFAQLIGAGADEIAITKNVSEGLNAIATAIAWREGDNVVLCSAVEHPNNIYLWHALARRGVTVRDIPARDGAIDTAAMAAAVDARTRVVTVSAVTFVPGFRTPLRVLADAAHRSGALFLVDAVQSCGVLELDVEAEGIDALATSASKGLLGLRGLGFLYVRRGWCERLTPAHCARNSFETHGAHYSNYEGAEVAWKPGAQRFEYGNYNYTGAAVASAAMAQILSIGISVIEARATALAQKLADALAREGLPVNQPPPGSKPSHLVTVGAWRAKTGGLTPELDAIADQLRDANVRFAIRRGMLRFGFHLYNNDSDIEAVMDACRRVRKAAA